MIRYIYLLTMSFVYFPYFFLYTIRNSVVLQEFYCFEKMYVSTLSISSSFRFVYLIEKYPEFVSLINYRLGLLGSLLSKIYKGQTNLYIVTEQIGCDLKIWHGYSTILNAKSIGSNCEIWHCVTIGNKNNTESNHKPIIGDNVKIFTGAIIVGDITIGDNVVIGANTVVTKSVPSNCTIVGNSFRIL